MCLDGMESRSHDLGSNLRMHSLTVHCYISSNEENVPIVVPVTSVEFEVTGSKSVCSTFLLKSLLERLGMSAVVCMLSKI